MKTHKAKLMINDELTDLGSQYQNIQCTRWTTWRCTLAFLWISL